MSDEFPHEGENHEFPIRYPNLAISIAVMYSSCLTFRQKSHVLPLKCSQKNLMLPRGESLNIVSERVRVTRNRINKI